MRKKIAAANWKMNLRYEQGASLLHEILGHGHQLHEHQQVLFSVPFPYLVMAGEKVKDHNNFEVAAQNCSDKKSGAYTGEVSAEMLQSVGISFVILGHSERREYFLESNELLARKIDIALANDITPIFCCGEPLTVRENEKQNEYVEQQIKESLFHLDAEGMSKLVIAYEPIWAIGTGRTASADQAQEMHQYIRSVFQAQYGSQVSENLSILYGGSVNGKNADELFRQPDVDGGLVGGASLKAAEFTQIIEALP
jgi:triosephosphate isomerase